MHCYEDGMNRHLRAKGLLLSGAIWSPTGGCEPCGGPAGSDAGP
jgi:hypothetical protein